MPARHARMARLMDAQDHERFRVIFPPARLRYYYVVARPWRSARSPHTRMGTACAPCAVRSLSGSGDVVHDEGPFHYVQARQEIAEGPVLGVGQVRVARGSVLES